MRILQVSTWKFQRNKDDNILKNNEQQKSDDQSNIYNFFGGDFIWNGGCTLPHNIHEIS